MKEQGGGTQTTTMEPPAYIKPYLDMAARGAFGLYAGPGAQVPTTQQQGNSLRDRLGGIFGDKPSPSTLPNVDPFSAWTPDYFPGSTVAPFSGATDAALRGITDRAMAGSPLVTQAQNYVQQGLGAPISSQFGGNNPYAAPVGTNAAANPYAAPVGTNQSANPYANQVGVNTSMNPYANAVSAGSATNPYAEQANPFGGATNPYLDATYNKALGSAMQGVESQFARGGRNIRAALPVAGDIASDLASQIYAPAYENERNRQLQFQSQLTGIGANTFDNAQTRQLQSGLAAQGIGAQGFENARAQQLQSGLAAQGIGAQGFENARAQQLQASLAGQGIGAQGFENARAQQLQAALQGQQIGASGYEQGQNRLLSDLTNQRSLQQNLLNFASPLAAQDYMDLAQLQGAGQAYDTQNQAQLNDQVNRFNYEQNRPGMALDSLLARLSGLPGSTQTTQLPTQYRNAAGGALGGALAGAQLGSIVPGLGTGIGALLGGLGGLL